MFKNLLFSLKQLWFFVKYKYNALIIGYLFDVPFNEAFMCKLDKLSFSNLSKFVKAIFKCKTDQERDTALSSLNCKYNKKQPYHWSHWVKDEPTITVTVMPVKYIRLMLTDWSADLVVHDANDKNIANWYFDNVDKAILHPHTRHTIELFLHTYCDHNTKTFSPTFKNFDEVICNNKLTLNSVIFVRDTQMYYMNKTGKNESALDWIVL